MVSIAAIPLARAGRRVLRAPEGPLGDLPSLWARDDLSADRWRFFWRRSLLPTKQGYYIAPTSFPLPSTAARTRRVPAHLRERRHTPRRHPLENDRPLWWSTCREMCRYRDYGSRSTTFATGRRHKERSQAPIVIAANGILKYWDRSQALSSAITDARGSRRPRRAAPFGLDPLLRRLAVSDRKIKAVGLDTRASLRTIDAFGSHFLADVHPRSGVRETSSNLELRRRPASQSSRCG